MKRMMAILVLSLPGMLGTCGTGIWDLQGGTGDPCQVLADFTTRVGKPYPPFKFSQQALRALTARINQKTRLKGKLQIFASAQGAFSAAGRHEVATLVFQETQASHAENDGRTFFVIDGGGPLKLVDLGHGGYDSISNTIRMPDGTDALFISNSYVAQGEVGVYGKLVSLAGPHAMVVMKDFHSVVIDTCGGMVGEEGGATLASKILYQFKNGKIQFRREHYRQSCKDSSRPVLVGTHDGDEGNL